MLLLAEVVILTNCPNIFLTFDIIHIDEIDEIYAHHKTRIKWKKIMNWTNELIETVMNLLSLLNHIKSNN